MIEFYKNGAKKNKEYLVDCIVKGEKHCLIIVITHDKYTFFANNKI